MPITYLDEPIGSKITYLDESPKQQGVQPQNFMGKMMNVPAASNRAAAMANPALMPVLPIANLIALAGLGGQRAKLAAASGAVQPDQVPSFQKQMLDSYYNKIGDIGSNIKNPVARESFVAASQIPGLALSSVGLLNDVLSSPADTLLTLATNIPGARQLGQAISKTKSGQKIAEVANKDLSRIGKNNIPDFQSSEDAFVYGNQIKNNKSAISALKKELEPLQKRVNELKGIENLNPAQEVELNNLTSGGRKHFLTEALDIAEGRVGAEKQRVINAVLERRGIEPSQRKMPSLIEQVRVDNVNRNIVPRAYEAYQQNVSKFTPDIQNFAENTLNVPKSAIDTIKKSGVDKIDSTRRVLNDSVDNIHQRIVSGIQSLRNEADSAYRMAVDSAKEGKSIDIKPAIEASGIRLKKLGLITDKGSLTELGKSEIAKDSVYGKLLDFYQSADAISGVKALKNKNMVTEGQLMKLVNSDNKTLVNKDQYLFLRDKLNALYKNKPSDIAVSDVVDHFYQSGEASGMKGLMKARSLQKKAFGIEDSYAKNAIIRENKLGNYHTLTEAERRNLQNLEDQIGVKFVDDLKQISAGQYIDKLKEFNPDRFAADLATAVNPTQTGRIIEKYKPLLGNKTDVIKKLIRNEQVKLGAVGAVGLTGVLKLGDLGINRLGGGH